jgi:acyl transferase domain-containing protein
VLTHALEQTADELGGGLVVLDTLRRDEGGLPRFLRAFGEAYCRGVNIDRTALYPGTRVPSVDLPTYPFHHRRYWLDESPSSTLPEPSELRNDTAARYDLRDRLVGSPKRAGSRSNFSTWFASSPL